MRAGLFKHWTVLLQLS